MSNDIQNFYFLFHCWLSWMLRAWGCSIIPPGVISRQWQLWLKVVWPQWPDRISCEWAETSSEALTQEKKMDVLETMQLSPTRQATISFSSFYRQNLYKIDELTNKDYEFIVRISWDSDVKSYPWRKWELVCNKKERMCREIANVSESMRGSRACFPVNFELSPIVPTKYNALFTQRTLEEIF